MLEACRGRLERSHTETELQDSGQELGSLDLASSEVGHIAASGVDHTVASVVGHTIASVPDHTVALEAIHSATFEVDHIQQRGDLEQPVIMDIAIKKFSIPFRDSHFERVAMQYLKNLDLGI